MYNFLLKNKVNHAHTNTIILHNNEIDLDVNYNRDMKIIQTYLIAHPNTNIILFNFNKQDMMKPHTTTYFTPRLIYVTLNHIDSNSILEKMFQYNIPFMNHVHKLYNFNILSNFYKYILIYQHLKQGNLIQILNKVILYTRFNVFMENIPYFNTKMKDDVNKFKRDPNNVEDIYYILYKYLFLKFLDAFETYSMIQFFSTIQNPSIEYPEYILSLFIDRYNIFRNTDAYINRKDLKFSQNINKYSVIELYDRLDPYIHYGYIHHKPLLFKGMNYENVWVDIHDPYRLEKYNQIHFRFISWSCPHVFTKEDIVKRIETKLSLLHA
jgi:hypothetical protein